MVFGRASGAGTGSGPSPVTTAPGGFLEVPLPVLAAVLIAISAVLSLVTIIAVYREGGILKRLRATPLRPQTILSAHVAVKLLLTAITLLSLILAGKRFYPIAPGVPLLGFLLALLISTLSILSIGFVIASIVPTARFAQPIGAAILYPMIGLSGIFVSVTRCRLRSIPSPDSCRSPTRFRCSRGSGMPSPGRRIWEISRPSPWSSPSAPPSRRRCFGGSRRSGERERGKGKGGTRFSYSSLSLTSHFSLLPSMFHHHQATPTIESTP